MLITCKLWRIWVFLPWIKTTSSLVLELWVDTLNYHPFSCFLWVMGWQFNFLFGKEVTMCFHQCNRKQLWGIGGVHVHIFAALIHILRWSSTSCTEVPAETSYPPQFAAPDIGLVIEFVVWWRRYFPQCLNESIFSGAIVNTENIPKHMGKNIQTRCDFFI